MEYVKSKIAKKVKGYPRKQHMEAVSFITNYSENCKYSKGNMNSMFRGVLNSSHFHSNNIGVP